jgi:hypothetical protein
MKMFNCFCPRASDAFAQEHMYLGQVQQPRSSRLKV